MRICKNKCKYYVLTISEYKTLLCCILVALQIKSLFPKPCISTLATFEKNTKYYTRLWFVKCHLILLSEDCLSYTQ